MVERKRNSGQEDSFGLARRAAHHGEGEGFLEIASPHQSPLTGEQCLGRVVIAFGSWPEALASQMMKEKGAVSAICSACGQKVSLGRDGQPV